MFGHGSALGICPNTRACSKTLMSPLHGILIRVRFNIWIVYRCVKWVGESWVVGDGASESEGSEIGDF